ncbi:hypothetical protein O181_073736 [Austropuccinia psidii MF-1]|uniref:C2H2-type domain-containing protein n=1 Tax=Austropuccinia psidii MF-1 TaxID=1389203 RepID=A0A9Q3FBP9_9BASI|nr:hypothetical protein [Austropuccinia psidii MF-1]
MSGEELTAGSRFHRAQRPASQQQAAQKTRHGTRPDEALNATRPAPHLLHAPALKSDLSRPQPVSPSLKASLRSSGCRTGSLTWPRSPQRPSPNWHTFHKPSLPSSTPEAWALLPRILPSSQTKISGILTSLGPSPSPSFLSCITKTEALPPLEKAIMPEPHPPINRYVDPYPPEYLSSSYPVLPPTHDKYDPGKNMHFLSFATPNLLDEPKTYSPSPTLTHEPQGPYADPPLEQHYRPPYSTPVVMPSMFDDRVDYAQHGWLYRPPQNSQANHHIIPAPQIPVFHEVERSALVQRPRHSHRPTTWLTRFNGPHIPYTHADYPVVMEEARYEEYCPPPRPLPQSSYPPAIESHGGRPAKSVTQDRQRPYTCEICGSKFNRNHDLKRHSRIHLEIKPFPCGWCEKSFSRKDALKRHLMVKACSGSKDVSVEESVRKAEEARRARAALAAAAEYPPNTYFVHQPSAQSNGSDESDQSPATEPLYAFRGSVCSASEDSTCTNDSVTCST